MGLDWDQLIRERDAWVAHNFPSTEKTAPMETIMGVFEECGELTHAHLKQRQAIRGDNAKHDADAQDAIGDATVYLLGVMSFTGHRPRELPLLDREASPDVLLLQANAAAGRLSYHMVNRLLFRGPTTGPINRQVDNIVHYHRRYCLVRGWDYDAAVQSTWDGVKQRDWIAYPDTGLPPVPA